MYSSSKAFVRSSQEIGESGTVEVANVRIEGIGEELEGVGGRAQGWLEE